MNKIQLQLNNEILTQSIYRVDNLIEIASSLPEAGSGSSDGSIETVIGSVAAYGPLGVSGSVYYVDGNGVSQQATSAGTISVMKNSFIYVKDSGDGYNVGGEITRVVYFTGLGSIYQATADFTVKC